MEWNGKKQWVIKIQAGSKGIQNTMIVREYIMRSWSKSQEL